MTSTEMRTDDSQGTSNAAPPEMEASNNDLCCLCLQALMINDQLAGGTVGKNTSNGKSTLDLSGFTLNDWRISRQSEFRQERSFDYHRKEERDASGWALSGLGRGLTQVREFCAGDRCERLVTLPGMLEISPSAPCRLCSILRALFVAQYAEHSWWNEHGSTLRFTIQYEWSEYRTRPFGENKDTIPPSSQSLDGLAVYVVRPGQKPNDRDVYQFDVVAWPGRCQEWLKIKHSPLDPDGPTSDRNIGFMTKCIDRCISDHPECRNKTSKTTFVPTRLLDLGDSVESSMRLIECSQSLSLLHPDTQLQYATLSYCWGKSSTLRTTTENKVKHETMGIEIHHMPATFQDAIYIVKKLGIQYLWIDALCIIQNDEDDWEAEAVTMCDIFAHSRITISAAKSSSSIERFLQRPIDETLPFQFRSTLKPDISGQYFIRVEPQCPCPAQNDIAQSSWKSRAWVWQEEIMSVRQFVFGNKTLQFRCSRGILLEDGRREYDPFMILNPHPDSWYSWMRIYSARALTYASDRLKGIAGVAKFIDDFNRAEGKPEQYLAGLWHNELECQLRWVCNEPSLSFVELIQLLRDRRKYIAPSWSWASRNTGVDCLVNGTRTVIRVIKFDLRASHNNAMVSLAFGSSITISGKYRNTPVEPSSGRLVMDNTRWPYKWEASSYYGRTDFWLDWLPKEEDAEERKYQRGLCLLFTTVVDRTDATAAGLIIAPVIDPGTGDMLYYRVGAFVHRGKEELYTGAQEKELTIR